MADIWLGLFSGIAFGFVIQRVGATNADKMARAHLMLEPGIPQFMLLAVALLVVFDAVATWSFIHQGGEEGNPIVAWFLELGPAAFWTLKLAPLPLMILYFASKRYFLWTRLMAYLLLVAYTALAGFHLYGIWSVWQATPA